MRTKTLIGLFLLGVAGTSSASTLTVKLNADDFATAYISTNDSVQGTQFLDKLTTWQGGQLTASTLLTDGVTNYLHIKARDAFGAPSMLIAEGTIDTTDFEFLNATQHAVTNASEWQASVTGFGVGYFAPFDLGASGTGPWGGVGGAGIDPAARLIWTVPMNQQQGLDTAYFSIAIRANAVPEPQSLLILAALVPGLLLKRRRRA